MTAAETAADDAPTTDQPHRKPPPVPAPRRASGPDWTRLLLGLLFQLTHRPKYEDRVSSPDDLNFTEEINLLGAQGWKLDTCRRATDDAGGARYECILSRPRLGW